LYARAVLVGATVGVYITGPRKRLHVQDLLLSHGFESAGPIKEVPASGGEATDNAVFIFHRRETPLVQQV
jgi:hypothetical protein